MPAVEEIATSRPAMLAHYWQYGACDIHRSEEERLDLMADLFWVEFLEEASEEITRVVNQNVDSTEPRDLGSRYAGHLSMTVTTRAVLPATPHHGCCLV